MTKSQRQARRIVVPARPPARREARTAPRESEIRFRQLAKHIQEVFWMCTADGTRTLYISPGYETIWGRPVELGKLPGEWLESIHPDDRERIENGFAERTANDRFEEEYRIIRPDGSERWVHDRGFAIRDDRGRIYRLGGIATDITERKRHEALAVLRARQQQAVAELGAFALKGGDVDALLHEAIRAVKFALGIDYCGVVEHLLAQSRYLPRFVPGISGEEVPTTESRDGHESASGYALLTGSPVIIENTATETRFSQLPWVRESGMRSGVSVPIGGEDAARPAFGTLSVYSKAQRVFSADDVFFLQGIANVLAAAISRRRGEEALQAAKEEAELANSAKSSFLSRMSHELRTPLNAVLGFSQLLQLDATTERQRECVRHVLEGGQNLLALIDDVLDISRLDLGRESVALAPFSPRDAIAASIEQIRPLAAERFVTVEFQSTPAADKAVLAYPERFNQILFNLLSNAVKYNLAGGRVSVICREVPAARLRILVSDTGPGIAPENLKRLFAPFDRLGAERTTIPGTGLGLALCKNLVEAQGGQIGVESVVGQGSTFWIQLPQAPPAARRAKPPAPAKRLVARGPMRRVPRQQRRQTILYIEDNLSNLTLIERLLARYPHIHLLTAALGQQGLETARRQRLDLILLDIHLPDLDGREVIDALKADPVTRDVPVVAISADATPATIAELLGAGAREYLTKPLNFRQLMGLVTELA